MFSMQTTLLPLSLCEEIDALTRKFVRSSTSDQKKVHLVSWDQVYQPRETSGLGLKRMRITKEAFMMKIC